MKLRLTFKTPDVVDNAVQEYINYEYSFCNNECKGCGNCDDPVENDRRQQYSRDDEEELRTFIEQYVKYGESITIEFDTEKNTATVVKAV